MRNILTKDTFLFILLYLFFSLSSVGCSNTMVSRLIADGADTEYAVIRSIELGGDIRSVVIEAIWAGADVEKVKNAAILAGAETDIVEKSARNAIEMIEQQHLQKKKLKTHVIQSEGFGR